VIKQYIELKGASRDALSNRKLAELFHVSEATIRRCRRLLELPLETQGKLLRGEISLREALGLKEKRSLTDLSQTELGCQILQAGICLSESGSEGFGFEIVIPRTEAVERLVSKLAEKYSVEEREVLRWLSWRVFQRALNRELRTDDPEAETLLKEVLKTIPEESLHELRLAYAQWLFKGDTVGN